MVKEHISPINLLDMPGEPTSGGFLVHLKMLVPSILVMVSLYTIFVAFFFFTYGASVEKDVVKNNAKLLVDALVDDIAFFGTHDAPGKMEKIKEALNKMKLPDTTKDDADVVKKDKQIIKQTFKVVGLGALGAMVIACLFWYFIIMKMGKTEQTWGNFCFNILTKSTLLLIIVASVEFCYFTAISKNYRALDPNIAKKAIVDSMQKELNKKK